MEIDAKRRTIVDEFGELDRRVKEFRPVAERRDELARTIESWFESEPAGQTFEVRGSAFAVQLSARANERRIVDMPGICRRLGLDEFLARCTFKLSVLEVLLPREFAGFLEEKRSGRRKLSAARLPAAANVVRLPRRRTA